MNILDENVPESQRRWLRSKRIRVQQIGLDIGRKEMKDNQIVPLLRELDRPTFFTLDADFHDRRLCHDGFCLVHLDVEEELAGQYVRQLMRHRALNTKTKRMGLVIRVSPGGLTIWRMRAKQEEHLSWK